MWTGYSARGIAVGIRWLRRPNERLTCFVVGSKQFSGECKALAVSRCQETTVTNLDKALRQDMLQEALHEGKNRRYHHCRHSKTRIRFAMAMSASTNASPA